MVWDPQTSYECVALRGLVLELAIGANPEEHGRRQRVGIEIELYRHSGGYRGGGLAACLDYSSMHRRLREHLCHRPHVELLEELAEELVALGLEDERVEACRVILRKLDVYGGEAVPEVQFYRRR